MPEPVDNAKNTSRLFCETFMGVCSLLSVPKDK